ncbi:WcbI family polysaccharide biosynthesis putative acetyltransferase [uncultured Enterovirga sp.]|uniref:WcbI family polysaccharide biosynthesis putative acetyltransferase n=1 Tax=uncultured Enterovirga sp. TaxID=2026352 RepID=UPI0035CB103C
MKPVVLALGTCISHAALVAIRETEECRDKFDFQYQFGTVDRTTHPIPDEILSRTRLIIQDLGPWQAATHLSEEERAVLPEDAVSINIPTLHFNTLWPLLGVDPRQKIKPGLPYGRYPMPWTDRVAMEMVRQYPDLEQRVAAYLAYDVEKHVDLDHFHTMQVIAMFQREQASDLQFAAMVTTNFTKECLYYENHHPSVELMVNLVTQILGSRKFAQLHRGNIPAMVRDARSYFAVHDPFAVEQVPIHPAVAKHFDLKWWSEDRIYPILGRLFTFESYIRDYMTEDMPAEDGS